MCACLPWPSTDHDQLLLDLPQVEGEGFRFQGKKVEDIYMGIDSCQE
jgi:hypothetical protein